MINGIKESKHSEIVVLNRPGVVSTGYNYTTPVQGMGGSLPYLIYDDIFSAFDEAPAGTVAIGDLVGGYYAMIDDPPTSPGPGDDYWSVTPPDSRRYQAWSRLEVETASSNSPAYWASHGWTSATASTDCESTTKLAASPKAAARQALRYLRQKCPGYSYTLNYVSGPNTPGAKWVLYYPYTYEFVTVPTEAYDAVVTVLNDTICTDVSYIYGTSVICATVYLTFRVDTTFASPGPAGTPSCAAAVDAYGEGLHIVRRV